MATIAYLRVSTTAQADSGAGLDAQEDACTKAAGILAGVFREEIGGGTGLEKRPVLLQAIAALKKGDVLMVSKRDRLGRGDPLLLAMIESAVVRKGARIQSAAGEGTDSDRPSDVLMRRMVDAFAEYERLIIGARTKAALGAKKARGECVGRVPFGYRRATDGVHLEEEPIEQETIIKVEELKATGLSLRQIADELNRTGVLKREGTPWNHVNLHTLCKRVA